MKYPIGIQSNIYKLGFPNKHVKNAFMTLMKYI